MGKTSFGVHYWTLIEAFWKFSIKRVILTQNRRFRVALTGLRVTHLQVRGLQAFRLLEEGPTVSPEPIFVRLTFSPVEVPKITQISQLDLQKNCTCDGMNLPHLTWLVLLQ